MQGLSTRAQASRILTALEWAIGLPCVDENHRGTKKKKGGHTCLSLRSLRGRMVPSQHRHHTPASAQPDALHGNQPPGRHPRFDLRGLDVAFVIEPYQRYRRRLQRSQTRLPIRVNREMALQLREVEAECAAAREQAGRGDPLCICALPRDRSQKPALYVWSGRCCSCSGCSNVS